MHIPIRRRFRSIVDESPVHCHRGCEFEPRHLPSFFDFIFYQFIYLTINNHFKHIWVAEYRFNDSKNAYPIELMHSVASRVWVFVFDNVLFDGRFVQMLKQFFNNA